MKKILVVGSRDSGEKNNPLVIVETLQKSGVDAEFIEWEKLIFRIDSNSVTVIHDGKELSSKEPDLVLAVGWYRSGRKSNYRDVALSLAVYLKHHDIQFWNSEMGVQRSTGKLSCLVMLALSGIAVTPTIYSLSGDLIVPETDYPLVIKATAASRGALNYLTETKEHAKELLSQQPNMMLVQPYLDNDHDLRVIMFGGKVSKVLRRSRSSDADTHLNNTSQGGSAVWLNPEDLDSKLLTICEKICTIMHREMAGIDLIPDAHSDYGYSCLEVNSVPQLTSGYDTDSKMAALVTAITQN